MIPSVEGWPIKAKEVTSPHEVRLALLDTNPSSCFDSDVKIFTEITEILIIKFFTIIYKNFLQVPTVSTVSSSMIIICKSHVLVEHSVHSLRSIATVSLKRCARDNPKTGVGGALFYCWHTSHELDTSFEISYVSGFFIFASFNNVIILFVGG